MFFVGVVSIKDHEIKTRQVLKPSPLRPLASDGHRHSQSPTQASPGPLHPLFNSPKFPLGLKADYQLLSVNFICSQPGCNHLTLSTYSQGLDVFSINRLFFFNVSNVRGLNYQYLHIQGLPLGETVNRTQTTLPIFFPGRITS